MAFIDTLKEAGLTDEELQALSPKIREAFETKYGQVAGERDEFKNRFETRDREWEEMKENVWNPKVRKLEEEVVAARRKAADLAEQVAIAAEWNLFPDKQEPAASAPPSVSATPGAAPAAFDAKANRVVTYDDAQRLVEAEGQAIVEVNDLAAEYRYLYNRDLFEYEGRDGLRGMKALRKEAIASPQKNLPDYVAHKFEFDKKRAELKAKQQAEYDARLIKQGREEAMKEYSVNPNLRGPSASRNPWLPPKTGETKPVFDIPAAQLRAQRQQRALESLLNKQQVN